MYDTTIMKNYPMVIQQPQAVTTLNNKTNGFKHYSKRMTKIGNIN